MIARALCRVFGHRLMRVYVLGRVGALACTRCLACCRFGCPGVTDEQIDACSFKTLPRGVE